MARHMGMQTNRTMQFSPILSIYQQSPCIDVYCSQRIFSNDLMIKNV